jgi:SAM-dependent methyltransferase
VRSVLSPEQEGARRALSAELFVPPSGIGATIPLDDVGRFTDNVLVEAEIAGYPAPLREALLDHKQGCGVARTDPAYWRRAYAEPLARAVHRVFADRPNNPTVLDIGAGTGTQSLLCAVLGARVTAVDLDATQLDTLRARISLYEQIVGAPLSIDVVAGDACDLEMIGPFDALYSHAAWSALLRPDDLFSTAARLQRAGGVLILKATNPRSVWARLARASVPDAPADAFRAAAQRHGYDVVDIRGTTSLPRAAWRRPMVAGAVDAPLGRIERLWVHTELTFARRA